MDSFDSLLEQAEADIAFAFSEALKKVKCKHVEAARGMRVSANTIANYVGGKTPVKVARALAFQRLKKAFLRELCRERHEHDSLPYLAKRRGSK